MKKLYLALSFLVLPPAWGAPFLVSDPAPLPVDKCIYQIGTANPVLTDTVLNGCRIDLASFPSGTTNLQVWFRATTWGTEGAKAPFVLIKPAAGFSAPAGLSLTP